MNEAFAVMILSVSIAGLLVGASNAARTEPAFDMVYIRADGSIDPSTAPILRIGLVYTFTDDIRCTSMTVERNSTVLDGACFTLQSSGVGCGLNLIGTDNVTIRNLSIRGFDAGILIEDSTNTFVFRNNITGSKYEGIYVLRSSHNSMVENNIVSGSHGIAFMGYGAYNSLIRNCVTNCSIGVSIIFSGSASLVGNNIANSGKGVYLERTYGGSNLTGNSITANGLGVYIFSSSGNKFCHNNFNNTLDIVDSTYGHFPFPSYNSWGDGVEGNHWSNYAGLDSNHDGIGDTPYVVGLENIDNQPLKGPFLSFNESSGQCVNVISNSTIDSFQYFAANRTIKMQVTNATASQTFGFCRISIPKALVDPETEPISVLIDEGQTPTLFLNSSLYDNGTHAWIYFSYAHSTHEIIIVPESPPSFTLLLLMITTLLTVFARRRKHNGTEYSLHVCHEPKKQNQNGA